MEEKRLEAYELIKKARHLVFFGGAGVSTESGIPDFRGSAGLYTQKKGKDAPEYLLSHTCLSREPEKFFDYYRTSMLYPDAQPNEAHKALAKLEEKGILQAVVTQNIDGLHQMAGSKHVYELHGSVKREYCTRCGRRYPGTEIPNSKGLPLCTCGGAIRPEVVLYEEGLPGATFEGAAREIRQADVLLVAGTSLTVYPAAGLVAAFPGAHLIIVNLTPTAMDDEAEFVFHESLSSFLRGLDLGD